MIGANNDLVVVSPAVRARNGESGANIRVKLHDKPFQLLLALLEHPGEVVDRRQLQERLWPDHTFVDFENGLNNAVGRLRKTLGDTAENPRFIETMPRHGYRFLPEVTTASPKRGTWGQRGWLIAAVVALLVALAVGMLLLPPSGRARPHFPPREAHKPLHKVSSQCRAGNWVVWSLMIFQPDGNLRKIKVNMLWGGWRTL